MSEQAEYTTPESGETNADAAGRLRDAYERRVAAGEWPSVTELCSDAGIAESEFYTHYSAPEAIGRQIWKALGQDIQKRLMGSQAYQGYGARERVLAYQFTFFELALAKRSFIGMTHDTEAVAQYKEDFLHFHNDLVMEGIAMDELKERLSLSSYYPTLLWKLHEDLICFWLDDTSEQFVETERAIEVKSKLPLELMGYNLLDSMYETLKFEWERFDRQVLRKWFKS